MKESIDEFLERVDDVLSRAFPGIDEAEESEDGGLDETNALAASADLEATPWPVSERRQQQLERLGNPDNESW